MRMVAGNGSNKTAGRPARRNEMNAKTKELINAYQADIAAIKDAREKYESISAQIPQNPTVEEFLEADEKGLYKAQSEAYQEWSKALSYLGYEIEVEYHNVPYALRREQGSNNFFKVAGLDFKI